MDVHPPRKLFWSTLIVLILITFITPIIYNEQLPDGIKIITKGQPTIGYSKATVHVVVFEEPKCVECKQFSNTVYPEIKKKYIDTNKILYTLVPVSFLPNSHPAAIALLSVYYSDPEFPNDELFFKFAEYLYKHQPPEDSDWATTSTLLNMAKNASPAINLEQLKDNLEVEKYRSQIEKNTLYAQKIMNGRIETPTVYVNGIKANTLSEDGLCELIDEVLERNGGN